MSLINNERVKLRATYLNGLAIAVFAVGSLAPLFSYVYSASNPGRPLWSVVLLSLISLVVSVVVHYIAGYTLRRLQP